MPIGSAVWTRCPRPQTPGPAPHTGSLTHTLPVHALSLRPQLPSLVPLYLNVPTRPLGLRIVIPFHSRSFLCPPDPRLGEGPPQGSRKDPQIPHGCTYRHFKNASTSASPARLGPRSESAQPCPQGATNPTGQRTSCRLHWGSEGFWCLPTVHSATALAGSSCLSRGLRQEPQSPGPPWPTHPPPHP